MRQAQHARVAGEEHLQLQGRHPLLQQAAVVDAIGGALKNKSIVINPGTILRLSIKKNLFPVQWVAKIEASRAANIFFFPLFFFFSMKILSIFGKKKNCKDDFFFL